MYSTEDISFRTQTMTVEKVLEGIEDHHIYNNDVLDYTKRLQIIECPKYSEYIESVMIGLPLLPIVFDGSRAPWDIIDGVKRVSALWGFASNVFGLKTVNYSRIRGNVYYADMDSFLKNRFLRAPIPCYIINPGTPKEVIEDIRNRIKREL